MIDLDKLVCYLLSEDGYRSITTEDIFLALKQQGLQYKEGAIVPIESNPKFKIGQTIVYKGTENIAPTKITISEIANGQYWDDNCCIIPISDQDNWELEKPSTIKFNEPDIDAMVEDFWNNKDVIISSHTRGIVEEAYRQGLEDMWKKLKK